MGFSAFLLAQGRLALRTSRFRSGLCGLAVLVLVSGPARGPGLMAEESGVAVDFSGRLAAGVLLLAPEDASLEGIDPALAGIVTDSTEWTLPGRVSGWLGFSGGNREVKAELRLGLDTWPLAALSLDRAWVKFRLPGFRASMGLGTLSWGPGFVFNSGDILNDSTGLGVDFSSDQIRSGSSWLGDFWFSLGPEAFLEIQARTPGGVTWHSASGLDLTVPESVLDSQAGIRVSVSPEGVLLEAGYGLDGKNSLHKFSLSTQFHAGMDWYASLRYDLPIQVPQAWDPVQGLAISAGAFGMADLGEAAGLSTRHEVLVLPGSSWDPGVAAPVRTPGQAGAGLPLGLYSYHELGIRLPESFSVTARGLVSWVDLSTLIMGEVDWNGLQGLTLYLDSSIQLGAGGESSGGRYLTGTMGDTFASGRQGWVSIGAGLRFRF